MDSDQISWAELKSEDQAEADNRREEEREAEGKSPGGYTFRLTFRKRIRSVGCRYISGDGYRPERQATTDSLRQGRAAH